MTTDWSVASVVRCARDERLEGLLRLGDTGDRECTLGGAVVGDRPGDDLVLRRLSDQLEVLLGELEPSPVKPLPQLCCL